MHQKINQQEEDADGTQLQASLSAISKRHVGLSSQDGKVIPLDALLARKQRQHQDAGQPSSSSGGHAASSEMELDDLPGTLFDGAGSSAVGQVASPAQSKPIAVRPPASEPGASPAAKSAGGVRSIEDALQALSSNSAPVVAATAAGDSGCATGGADAAASKPPKRRLTRKTSAEESGVPPARPQAQAAAAVAVGSRNRGGVAAGGGRGLGVKKAGRAGGRGGSSGGKKVDKIKEEIEVVAYQLCSSDDVCQQ